MACPPSPGSAGSLCVGRRATPRAPSPWISCLHDPDDESLRDPPDADADVLLARAMAQAHLVSGPGGRSPGLPEVWDAAFGVRVPAKVPAPRVEARWGDGAARARVEEGAGGILGEAAGRDQEGRDLEGRDLEVRAQYVQGVHVQVGRDRPRGRVCRGDLGYVEEEAGDAGVGEGRHQVTPSSETAALPDPGQDYLCEAACHEISDGVQEMCHSTSDADEYQEVYP